MTHQKGYSPASIIQERLLNCDFVLKLWEVRLPFLLMKKIFFFLALLISSFAFGQSMGYLRYDTVMLQKIEGNSELNILNGTRSVTNGVLTNVGNGRTRFILPASPSVTGANNGDTLIGGMVGLGGALIRSTRISASNNRFVLDSLGQGTRFVSYPQTLTTKGISMVSTNGTDSVYMNVEGSTSGTIRRASMFNYGAATNSYARVMVEGGAGYPFVNIGTLSIGTNNSSAIYLDSTFIKLYKTTPTKNSALSIYTDSTVWWIGYDRNSQIGLYNGYQDSWARDSLIWRSQNRNTHISIYPDSMSFWQSTGEYYVYNLNRITDSTGLDLMAFDRATSEWVRIPSDIVGGSGATPNLQAVFATQSNSPVMTANANEIKLNPAGSSGVVKTFSLGATSFADDARMLITNDGAGNGSFDVWAQDSANNNQVFMRSDIVNKRVYLHSARAAASANNLFVYSDSTVFQFTAGTADYRFKGITDLLYPDTTLNLPATLDAQGRLKRLSYWPSGGGGASTWNGITNPTGDQALTFDAGESSTWTNSNTTENLFTINTSTITTANQLSLVSTSTALAAGNEMLNVDMSGANGTASITATGARITVANTGTTNTNIGLDITVTNGALRNYSYQATGPAVVRLNAATTPAYTSLATNTFEVASNTSTILAIYSSSGANWSVLDFNYAASTHLYQVASAPDNEFWWYNGATKYFRMTLGASAGKSSFGSAAPTPSAWVTLAAGTTAALTAPLKFTSGSLMTTAEAGAVEYLTDKFYGTITTGAARKELTLNDAALTSGTTPVATTNGRLTDGLIIAQGTYTPTLTNVANLDASTAYSCQYMRVGNTVTVSGRVDIDPTLTATSTQLGISLPIASALANANELGGASASPAIVSQSAAVLGDATNDRAQLQYMSTDVTNQAMYFTFSYRIL